MSRNELNPIFFDETLFTQLSEKQIEYIKNMMMSQYNIYKDGLDEFEKLKKVYNDKITNLNEKKQIIAEKEYQKRRTLELNSRIHREKKLLKAFIEFNKGYSHD